MDASDAMAKQLEGFLEGIEQMRKYMNDAQTRGDAVEAEKWKKAITGSFAGIEKWREANRDLF